MFFSNFFFKLKKFFFVYLKHKFLLSFKVSKVLQKNQRLIMAVFNFLKLFVYLHDISRNVSLIRENWKKLVGNSLLLSNAKKSFVSKHLKVCQTYVQFFFIVFIIKIRHASNAFFSGKIKVKNQWSVFFCFFIKKLVFVLFEANDEIKFDVVFV